MEKKQMTLEQIKKTEHEILRHFKEVCEKEEISFFLSNGTLLGAVKYGGFIPWDDDIDVFVPRADYDRLMRIYQDSSRYCLFSHERNSGYKFPFAKLCDMTTRKVETNIDNGVELGLDIDIFPLDAWDNAPEKQVQLIGSLIRKLTFVKSARADSANRFKRFAKTIVLGLTRQCYRGYIQKIWTIARKNANDPNPVNLGCVSWCIYGEREIIPADVFASTVEVDFEGDRYPAPVGYDRYLRSLYSDYTKDLPLDQQKTHHRYQAYTTVSD